MPDSLTCDPLRFNECKQHPIGPALGHAVVPYRIFVLIDPRFRYEYHCLEYEYETNFSNIGGVPQEVLRTRNPTCDERQVVWYYEPLTWREADLPPSRCNKSHRSSERRKLCSSLAKTEIIAAK